MLVTLSGMLMLVRDSHQENAESPILVTLFGMLMLVRDLLLLNIDFNIIFPIFLSIPDLVVGMPVWRAIFCFA